MRMAFAGDRGIAVKVLSFMLGQGVRPSALLVSESGRESHARQLAKLCAYLEPEHILHGPAFRQAEGVALLRSLKLDLLIGVHFPYIVPPEVLSALRLGVLNLHPAYLPYNRGWHTPSWAILEGTPIGATLHFMDAGVDTGDIVHQKRLEVLPGDTANSLYQRLKDLEFDVFSEAWPCLVSGDIPRRRQIGLEGTTHRRDDLFKASLQHLDLDETLRVGDVLRRLRALTTDRLDEAAYYEVDGRRYRVQVRICEDTELGS